MEDETPLQRSERLLSELKEKEVKREQELKLARKAYMAKGPDAGSIYHKAVMNIIVIRAEVAHAEAGVVREEQRLKRAERLGK